MAVRVTGAMVQVVQFVHPGFEYYGREHVGHRRVGSGIMAWKTGNSRHDRKFMLSRGSFLDWASGGDRPSAVIAFWGEWEGPSVFWRAEDTHGWPQPTIVHAPFLPRELPCRPIQNTDPIVFGDAFRYSNCYQETFPTLATLGPGSIILFGRHGRSGGRRSFSLDTCLVIDRAEPLACIDASETYGSNLLADAVRRPIASEGAGGPFTLYSGRRPDQGVKAFSFFPARDAGHSLPLFARPELRPGGAIQGVVNPDKMQGIKVSHVTEEERDRIWREVATQVADQGCVLGYHAAPPPMLDERGARSAVGGHPRPF